MFDLVIIFGSGLVGFLIAWKMFNMFLSLETAVGLSTFSYYVKKFITSLVVAFISVLFAAGYIGGKKEDKKPPAAKVEEVMQSSKTNIQSNNDYKQSTQEIITEKAVNSNSVENNTQNTNALESDKEKQ